MDEATYDDERLLRVEARAIGAGAAGGLLAGLAMGVLFALTTDVLSTLGTFVGESGPLGGLLVHMTISLFYGVAFAVVVAYPPVADLASSFGVVEWVLVGITYTVMVAAATLGVLPFVFELPWETAGGESPFARGTAPGIMGLLPGVGFAVGHIVFGAILGGVYAWLGIGSEAA